MFENGGGTFPPFGMGLKEYIKTRKLVTMFWTLQPYSTQLVTISVFEFQRSFLENPIAGLSTAAQTIIYQLISYIIMRKS